MKMENDYEKYWYSVGFVQIEMVQKYVGYLDLHHKNYIF